MDFDLGQLSFSRMQAVVNLKTYSGKSCHSSSVAFKTPDGVIVVCLPKPIAGVSMRMHGMEHKSITCFAQTTFLSIQEMLYLQDLYSSKTQWAGPWQHNHTSMHRSCGIATVLPLSHSDGLVGDLVYRTGPDSWGVATAIPWADEHHDHHQLQPNSITRVLRRFWYHAFTSCHAWR